MQLLIGLGLIPDPDAKDDELEGGMTKSEREEKLKEVGLFIPAGSMDAMNDEMERLALDNYNKMMVENMNRLSKEEVTTLRKLGMSNEQIAELGPDQNPFTDQGLGRSKDPTQLFDNQKAFYEELQAAWKLDQEDDPLNRAAEEEEGATNVMQTPVEYKDWSDKRKLDYDRKRMQALKAFFD